MTRKTYTNHVLAGKANGGLHSARKLGTLRQFMTTHDLKKALLYQFILSGSDSRAEYQATIKALIRHIRTKCRAEYIGAFEVGDEKGGLHCHCYILIESAPHFPADLLDVREGKFIARRIKRTGMSIRIAPPQNRMHGGEMYARMNTPEKLADCIKWASYFLKVRSKQDVPGRETYFGSEFASNVAKREAQRQKHRDALTIRRTVSTPNPTLKKEIQNERQFETKTETAGNSTTGSEKIYSTKASTSDECRSNSRVGETHQVSRITSPKRLSDRGAEMQLRQVRHKQTNLLLFERWSSPNTKYLTPSAVR